MQLFTKLSNFGACCYPIACITKFISLTDLRIYFFILWSLSFRLNSKIKCTCYNHRTMIIKAIFSHWRTLSFFVFSGCQGCWLLFFTRIMAIKWLKPDDFVLWMNDELKGTNLDSELNLSLGGSSTTPVPTYMTNKFVSDQIHIKWPVSSTGTISERTHTWERLHAAPGVGVGVFLVGMLGLLEETNCSQSS